MFNYSVADYQDIDEDRHVMLGALPGNFSPWFKAAATAAVNDL